MKPPAKLPADEVLDREPLITGHAGREIFLERLRLGPMAPNFGHGVGLVPLILLYVALFLIILWALR